MSDDIERALRMRRAELAAERDRLDAELRRVDAVLRELEPPRDLGTFELLRAFAPSGDEFDAHAALSYLRASGWQDQARGHALNTVRTALAHLAKTGELVRVRRGIYRRAVA